VRIGPSPAVLLYTTSSGLKIICAFYYGEEKTFLIFILTTKIKKIILPNGTLHMIKKKIIIITIVTITKIYTKHCCLHCVYFITIIIIILRSAVVVEKRIMIKKKYRL